MAVTFIEQKKKQKKMILVFAGMVLMSVLVLWWGGFLKGSSRPSGPGSPIITEGFPMAADDFLQAPPTGYSARAEINFKVLESPFLKGIQLFKTAPLDGEAGRENPFIPY